MYQIFSIIFTEHTEWKVSIYGDFPGWYFLAFGLNTEIYSVNIRIQSEYRKMGSRKKIRIWTLFTQWHLWVIYWLFHYGSCRIRATCFLPIKCVGESTLKVFRVIVVRISPNAAKYGAENLRIRKLFTQCWSCSVVIMWVFVLHLI